jgi:hypothetical protein
MSFANTCSVAVNNTYSTCGTLTRANIATLTPAEILALFQPTAGTPGQWAEMESLLKHQIEMRACGIVRSPLYDWIMSSNKTGQGALVNVHRVAKGTSLVQPFILGLQKSVWNQDYWTVVAGFDATTYEAEAPDNKPLSPVTAGHRILRLSNVWGSLHPEYFLPRQVLIVVGRGAGNAYTLSHYKVTRAGMAGPTATYVDVEAIFEQATTAEAGGAIFPSDPAVTSGMVLQGINNVHDAEQWCYNRHNVNLNKLVPFWYQTRRNQRCVDSEYQKVFGQLMAQNEYYAKFVDLPLAERNRQDERFDRVEFMNSFFFGDRISDAQTIDSWKNLEPIYSVASGTSVDPGIGTQLMGYRANMIGVLPQLKSCGQFQDLAGQDLQIRTLLETWIYDISRARQSSGRPHTEIDIYTNSVAADQFMTAFIAYSNAKVGGLLQININEGTSEIGMPYRRFKLYIPAGVVVNIITDPFFDDIKSAANEAGADYVGSYLMILDLGSGGSIYPATLASNRKVYTVGELENLARIDNTFSCVMTLPTRNRTLTSQTTTAIVECPLNSLVVANFRNIIHS